ncbi:hypothetical protein D9758_016696 [Tetrapyrgos nigripes]|uniref:SCP domain-containing protein n=1 Tax=Tetrapyrgos nigripes TaxID=182062 RepID=A0A8H5FGR1_9AGAR|nr:hypothetical protein D9758_016696 [Tetrapyrgos nigripes]
MGTREERVPEPDARQVRPCHFGGAQVWDPALIAPRSGPRPQTQQYIRTNSRSHFPQVIFTILFSLSITLLFKVPLSTMQLTLSFASLAILFASSVSALPSTGLEARESFKERAIHLHNTNRAKFGAGPVTWNGNIASGVQHYANKCVFKHSGTNGVGENLAAGSGDFTMKDAMDSWMNEESKYNYNHPGFSEDTGHFTQVVWKGSHKIACAIADCPAGTIFPTLASKFVVCQYTPPGNVLGHFPANVGRPQ